MLRQTFLTALDFFSLDFYKQLFDHIELTAGIDGSKVVASFEEMKTHGLHWVMADFKIVFISGFSFTNEYTIVTFPTEANALYAIRAHNIYNAAGEMMAQSFTRWVTMQIETRGVGRIPAHLIERIYERELTALPYERLRLQKNFEVQRFNSYRIKASDVDQNEHTNNTVYMLKCIEAALSLGIDLKAMRAFSIQFKQETRLNSILEIQSAYNSRLCQLMIKDSDTSAEVSLAEIVFDR